MNILKIKFLLFSLILPLAGCSFFHNGETISGQFKGGTIIPGSASRVYIKPFTGGTNGAVFNNEFSRRLKRTINLDGRLAVVESAEESDLLLDVSLAYYAEENVRFDVTGRPVMRRISITVRVTLAEKLTGRIIIKDKETDLFSEYNPDNAIIDEVYRQLADRASAAVLSIILTGWASGTSQQNMRDL